jgi:hypothetical protein
MRWGLGEGGRLPGAQALEGGLDALAVQDDVSQLDVLIAADQIRQLEQLDGGVMGLRGEQRERVADELLVLVDQLTLDPPHLRATERIELRSA